MTTKTGHVYGLHAVASLLARRPAEVTALTVAEGAGDRRLSDLLEAAGAAGIAVRRVARKELDKRFPAVRHQGVVATVAAATPELSEKGLADFLAALAEPAFLLVLDGVQDPHNLGACLRTADAAGVHAVILPRDRASGITPVVHKVACGAVESVPVCFVTNLARTLRQLREAGIWIYGASDAAGQLLYDTDLRGPVALVLGGEGKGLRRLTRELCDYLVAIPMAGQVESLNVSVAAGVLLYEARRQRNQEGQT
ncbi:MAG: 23S rRNA (guanosine(2251)-2'-O)-methyltransferase RlmB [Gammaproteobacteria bacterium]|jgi:23S rRNA (guanosine2251-2'-O)-methyltransferase